MTRRCCVFSCTSKSPDPSHRGVTFHSFPFDSKTREMWLSNCRIPADKNITKSVLVCSRHFRRTDFQPMKSNKYLLKPGTVPTIFPWGKLTPPEPKGTPEAGAPTEELPSSDVTGTEETSTTADLQQSVDALATQTETFQTPAKRAADAINAPEDFQSKMPRLTMELVGETAVLAQPLITSPQNESQKFMANLSAGQTKTDTNIGSVYVPGVRLEAQDFDGVWHAARVIEVDNDEREVLIQFEKSGKSKASTGIEEWIPMNSSRLRQKVTQTNAKPPPVFVLGEKCLARWSGPRRFPATIAKVLGNNTYEVLFDDGYSKVVRGAHVSKIKPPPEKASTSAASKATTGTKTPQNKDWPLISISSLNLEELNLPEIPKDGEWCCHWVNDQPIGQEGFLTVGDHRKPTVIVEDWRLPPNWVKHMYQRSNVLGKWDVILINPQGKRFRSKADLKIFIEDQGQVYNPDVYDFSIHRRRAKDINAYAYTKDYKPPTTNPPPPILESQVNQSPAATQQLPILPQPAILPTPIKTPSKPAPVVEQMPLLSRAFEEETLPLEDGYVYVGSLKVQIVDNLFRCPQDGCNKNFRKENHLQIHIKHYHGEIAKGLGVCPNMQDLACKRTIGESAEEPLPKNHLPNAQFFAKLHQQDLQSKVHRKPTPSSSLTMLATSAIEGEPGSLTLDASAVEDLKVAETLQSIITSTPAKNVTSVSGFDSEVLDTTGASFDYSIASAPGAIPQTQQQPETTPLVVVKAAPSRSKKGGRSTRAKQTKKASAARRIAASAARRLPRTPISAPAVTGNSTFEGSFGDFEETRHSFNGTPENKNVKKKLIQAISIVSDSNLDGNSQTTGSYPEQSQSPKYINENGELIKIVRMRQEEIINCLCSYGEEDGLMIQCELCLCWQHGICNGIEKESQVPDKYVCYICRNPQRGRASLKYIHDQDWLYDGKLAVAGYHGQNPALDERFEILRKSHTLTGNLLELKKFMHSLKVKINIAENKDHPKMYLWAKKWETSPTQSENKNLIAKREPQSDKLNTSDNKLLLGDVNKDIQSLDTNENQAANDVKPANDVEKAKIDVKQVIPNKANVKFNLPTIPQPEAAIDPAECQYRLLEHIQKQQQGVMDKLQAIESQIIDLESLDNSDNMQSTDYTKTKQTVSMLVKDLETMKNIAKINTVYPTYEGLV